VSVKVVLDASGHRPVGGNLSTDEGIQNSVANANRKLAGFGRGYQMNLIEIRDLPGHSELYDVTECEAVGAIKAGIQINPASYLWVPDAMNIYVNNGGTLSILTSDQLDKMTDTANIYVSSNIVSGFTHFVDRNNGCLIPTGSSKCQNNVGGPFPTVAGGISFAVPGDIVLVHVGHYNEPMTIRKAITLRATRGNVLLGKP
jgi:hypothetical protein